jgi:hypothetical protein
MSNKIKIILKKSKLIKQKPIIQSNIKISEQKDIIPNKYKEKNKQCIILGCNNLATYGTKDKKIEERCINHKLSNDTYIKNVNKLCQEENCLIRATFGIKGTKKGIYCLEHNTKGYIKVVGKKCYIIDCYISPSYGIEGTKKPIYCKNHIPKNTDIKYVNVVDKKCLKCSKQSTFGIKGTKNPLYCLEHKNKEHVDVINKKCIGDNGQCIKNPLFGTIDTMKAEYCKEHKPNHSYIDVISKQCEHEGCYTHATFGKINTKKLQFCVKHCPDDTYIRINSKKCKEEGCNTRPSYGTIEDKIAIYCKKHGLVNNCIYIPNKSCIFCDSMAIYTNIETNKVEVCKLHIPKDKTDLYIFKGGKRCIDANCNTFASYGERNTKNLIYCKKHCPNTIDYTDNKHDKCTTCDKIPVFGLKGTKDPIYCSSCIPINEKDKYMNVVDKQCIYSNCTTLPTFGKFGTKLREYCFEHKIDNTYVNVKDKTCIIKGCNKKPNCNYIGYSASHCSEHKQKGMILNPLVKCSLCTTSKKKIATKVKDKLYYCDEHDIKDTIDIHNICSICFIIINPQEYICKSCESSKIDGKTIKRKIKELEVKQKLEDSNIDIYLYDKIITNGCSKRRPDFIINCNWGYIIIEVDEYQHNKKSYTCECEISRMKEIYFDIRLEEGKILFIRYNPDSYKPSYGDTFTINEKLDSLMKIIKNYMNNEINNHLEVLYLFYDGYTQLTPEIDIINPYEK